MKYKTIETVNKFSRKIVERGQMDITNTQLHGVSIQFIYMQHIEGSVLSCQFYDALQFILLGKLITIFDDG